MSIRQVPFFNYPFVGREHENEVQAIIKDVIARGAFIQQKDLVEFEENLAKFLGCKYALGVANGTDGLIIALRAAGMKEGDEAIVCSHTMVATAASVHFAGGTPILVECGPDHMMDPQSVKKAVTVKTRFLMPTQLNGRTCDMDALKEIAHQHKLTIVEDSAQALGSKFKNQHAGTFGVAGMFSFYPAKVLGCFGDGGAVVTSDEEQFHKMTLLRDHGRTHSGDVEMWGLNSRLDNIQAAIMNVKFKYYPQVMARRREIAGLYQEGLGGLSELVLPPAPNADARHFDIYQNYEMECERRDELKTYLSENGIGTLIQWGGKAVHQMAVVKGKFDLPVTTRMTSRFLMVPMNMSMNNDDVAYVIEKIRAFYRK